MFRTVKSPPARGERARPSMSLPDTVLEEEIRRLEELRTRNPRGHLFARLADLYRKTGEPEKALEIVEAGLVHHPHYLNAHLIHGRVLTDLGRGSEAAAAFRRVLEIDDDNLVARESLTALEPQPESTSWLAQLEAEWRERRDSPAEREAEEPLGPASDKEEVDEEIPDRTKPEAVEEVATATLAELYLRQGLYEEAISVYEKLLARDPYSARLAASLEEARRLSREGSRRDASPTPAVPPVPREFPRPEPRPRPMRADEPRGLTIREQLTAILEERASLPANPGSEALRRLGRWLADATDAGAE